MPNSNDTLPSYGPAMEELEQIVAKLQNPDCDVDQLTTLASRAVVLLKRCREQLTKTDEQLTKILAELN